MSLAKDAFTDDMAITDKIVNDLVAASLAQDVKRISTAVQKLIAIYYGKGKQQGVWVVP